MYDVCNCFTVKVFVSNFKVEKVENLDIAFYVFLRFFGMTLQKKRKKSRFLDFQKNVKNVFSNYGDETIRLRRDVRRRLACDQL